MLIEHVKQQGEVIVVKIPETKTKVVRTFTIENQYANMVRKYTKLRPAKCTTNRFFLCYRNGKCTQQPIGKNKFLTAPKEIANFLQLADSETYTGHSFRRTSATLLANAGADITTLKRHGGWRSTTVAEGYIESSIKNKRKIGQLIASEISRETQSDVINVTSQRSSVQTQIVMNASACDIVCDDNEENQSKEENNMGHEYKERPSKIAKIDKTPEAKFNFINCTVNIYAK